MIYGADRGAYRQIYFDAWKKFIEKQVLTDIEKQIAEVIQLHPEYHYLFENDERYKEQDFFPELGETNPFLHLSLHLTILEQLSVDLPKGIRSLYAKLQSKLKDSHEVEHLLINCLIEELWQAQAAHREFSSENYMQLIQGYF